MPTQIVQSDMAANNSSNVSEIKVKTVFNGEVMIHYLDHGIEYEDLYKEIRGICRFASDQVSQLHLKRGFLMITYLFPYFFFKFSTGVYHQVGRRGA